LKSSSSRDDQEQEQLKPVQPRKAEKEKWRGQTTDERNGQLDFDEPRREVILDEA